MDGGKALRNMDGIGVTIYNGHGGEDSRARRRLNRYLRNKYGVRLASS